MKDGRHGAVLEEFLAELPPEWREPFREVGRCAMALGYTHALFEVAIGALKNAQKLDDHASVRDALRDTKHSTVVGGIDFKNGPLPNSFNTPVVGGQWRRGKKWPQELVIVDNTVAPAIPVGGEVEAISYK